VTAAFHELAMVSPAGSENATFQLDVLAAPVLVTVKFSW